MPFDIESGVPILAFSHSCFIEFEQGFYNSIGISGVVVGHKVIKITVKVKPIVLTLDHFYFVRYTIRHLVKS
jgi:hypothetical protein